jgi:GTPase
MDTSISTASASVAAGGGDSGTVTTGGAVDVRVAVIGNVDSGKSTLVGCLTKVMSHVVVSLSLDCVLWRGNPWCEWVWQRVIDDGRGKARSLVFRFRHEQENGRTSSVATEVMGFHGGAQVPVDPKLSRAAAFQTVHARADHSVTLVDLCGHERYLKTTVFGLTALVPDYALVIVGANMGVSRMTKVCVCVARILFQTCRLHAITHRAGAYWYRSRIEASHHCGRDED